MHLSLLLPSALFALFALALPLLLHLHRRRETPPPRLFAALAYIDPQARPKQHLRLRDLPLLTLRLLLLATLALALAQPLLHGRAGAPWVLLWPGLDTAKVGEVSNDAELRWLAPGFPRVDDADVPTRDAPFSLLRQLAFEAPTEKSIEIRVPRHIEGWDGGPLHAGRTLGWTVLPVELPAVPSDRPPLRVAVHASPDLEASERHALSALRTYFDALGDSTPLRLIEAGDAPDQAGADVLWVLSAAHPGADRIVDDDDLHATEATHTHTGRTDESGTSATPDTTQGTSGRASHTSFEARQQYAEGVLRTLPLPWQRWLRADRLLVIGHASRVAATQPSPVESIPADAEHERRDPAGHATIKVHGQADTNAADVAQSHVDALWRGPHATLSVHAIRNTELRVLDCGLDPSCLPELLEPHFPQLLQTWLTPTRPSASRIDAATLTPSTDGITPEPAGTPLRDALIAVVLLLLLAERWMAATRRPA